MLDITETHYVREEQEVFPLAEQLTDAKTLTQLGTEVSAE